VPGKPDKSHFKDRQPHKRQQSNERKIDTRVSIRLKV
jgi:hypothetical protein